MLYAARDSPDGVAWLMEWQTALIVAGFSAVAFLWLIKGPLDAFIASLAPAYFRASSDYEFRVLEIALAEFGSARSISRKLLVYAVAYASIAGAALLTWKATDGLVTWAAIVVAAVAGWNAIAYIIAPRLSKETIVQGFRATRQEAINTAVRAVGGRVRRDSWAAAWSPRALRLLFLVWARTVPLLKVGFVGVVLVGAIRVLPPIARTPDGLLAAATATAIGIMAFVVASMSKVIKAQPSFLLELDFAFRTGELAYEKALGAFVAWEILRKNDLDLGGWNLRGVLSLLDKVARTDQEPMIEVPF